MREVIKAGPEYGAKLLVLAVLCAGLGSLGLPGIAPMIAILLSGLAALAGLIAILRPPRLEIRELGFIQFVLWHRHAFDWNDVDHFRVVRTTLMTSVVGFDYADRRAAIVGANINRAMTGADFLLNSGLGDPGPLASRLSDAKAKAGSGR